MLIFADDMQVYAKITSSCDAVTVQDYLSRLGDYCLNNKLHTTTAPNISQLLFHSIWRLYLHSTGPHSSTNDNHERSECRLRFKLQR